MLLKKAWLHLIINKLSEGCFQFSKFISHPPRIFFPNPEKNIHPTYTSKYQKSKWVEGVDKSSPASQISYAKAWNVTPDKETLKVVKDKIAYH